jgi:HK97 family phage prohead protease
METPVSQRNPNIERRFLSVELRSNKRKKIAGYATKFAPSRTQDLGGFIEQVDRHAFDKHLATKPDVRCLFNHSEDNVLGRTTNGSLVLRTDNVGLWYDCDPAPTQLADDVLALIGRGDITQSSYGFICIRDQWSVDNTTGKPLRTVLEAELFDVSPVTFPANVDATVVVRAATRTAPADIRSKLLHLLLLRNDPTDSTAGPGRIVTSQTPDGVTTQGFGADFCQCLPQDRKLQCSTCDSPVLYLPAFATYTCLCGDGDAPNHMDSNCGQPFSIDKVRERPTTLELLPEVKQAAMSCVNHRCERCSATWTESNDVNAYAGDSSDQQVATDDRSILLSLLQRRATDNA